MKQTILLSVMMLTALVAQAQTLEECCRLAREHYPEIRQYDLIAETEQYNISNAARAWIPQVVLSGQATYQSATPTYPEAFNQMIAANGLDMSGVRKDQYKVVIDVSQNIWDGGQSKANREIAEAEATEQRSQVDASLYDLQSRIQNLYFGILLLDEHVAQTEILIEVLDANLNRMCTYYKNGVAMQSDVDAVEAELLTAHQALSQVEASRASYRRMLEVFIGQSLTDKTLTRPAMVEVASRTSAHPKLVMFDAQTDRLAAQRKAITASTMPRFSAFAQGYYGYPGLDMFKSMVSAKWTLNAVVGVRMSWNIGAFYTKKNNLNKLDVAERQISVQRDIFLFNTQMQSTQDDGEIARLRSALEDDNRIVELRRSVRMAAESRLENGVIDATDLLRKIADETTATLNRSTHEIELLQATYRLKTILNQ
ncbi:MAG: TolC family protein [Alistipes sp.]|nr:TolC family protein [Alistipes sp.]MBQ8778895.1 TolC family protein [Alistipes sp.]